MGGVIGLIEEDRNRLVQLLIPVPNCLIEAFTVITLP